MRRLLLVNALIFAVLAAAVTLVYYSYSYASSVASSRQERDSMHEIADGEGPQHRVPRANGRREAASPRAPRSRTTSRAREPLAAPPTSASVFVLDEQGEVLPGGYYGLPRSEKESAVSRVVPEGDRARAGLAKLAESRHHLYRRLGGAAAVGWQGVPVLVHEEGPGRSHVLRRDRGGPHLPRRLACSRSASRAAAASPYIYQVIDAQRDRRLRPAVSAATPTC